MRSANHYNITNSTDDLVAYFGLPQSISANQPIIFNNLSNNATSYSWNFGNGQTSTSTNPSTTYTYNGTYTITLTAYNGANSDSFSRTIVISNGIAIGTYPANYVHCGTPTAVVDVISVTGKTWMDRNLGASQVATSATDALAYGDLYQWGRFADGHQCRTSPTTTTLSTTDTPGHGSFIISSNDSPYDWRSPQNDNLWQGVNGLNNPCPNGYRLPTNSELSSEISIYNITNRNSAFTSPYKFTASGYRDNNSGVLWDVGNFGDYSSSSVIGINSSVFYFHGSEAEIGWTSRAVGVSVRCIKD